MAKTQSLMTEKEKSYVSSCFNKNIKVLTSSIPLDRVFNDEKISVEIHKSKKEIKVSFGKTGKRSRKWQRPAVNTETPFLANRLVLAELLDTNAILRCISLDDDSKTDLEESSLEYFGEYISKLVQFDKTYDFILEFLSISSSQSNSKMFELICKNIGIFNDKNTAIYSKFENLLNRLKPVISETKLRIPSALFQHESGYAFAIFLIQNNLKIAEALSESFMNSEVSVEKSFYKFVNLLYAVVSSSTKTKLKNFVKKIDNLEISNLVKDLTIS